MFVERTQFTVLRNIELPYLRQTPHGVKKIDKLCASTVGSRELKMSMRYWWLSNCMEDSSAHVKSLILLTALRIRLYTAMHFNSRISWRYLLARKVHPSDAQQQRSIHREVLYRCSFSMACTCSWTATVSSSSRIFSFFCSTNALIQPLFWRGGLSQVFWQRCQFPDTFSICKPFFVARTTLTLVKGTVTNRTNT